MTTSSGPYVSSAGEAVRGPVSRLQPATGILGLRFEPPNGRFWAQGEVVAAARQDQLTERDKVDTQRIPPNGTPGYAVANLRAGVALGRNAGLSVALENLFDHEYRIHGSGVTEPGFNLVVAFDATW